MYSGYTKGMETCEFNFFNSKSLRFYPIHIKYLGYLSGISYPMISVIFLGLSKKKKEETHKYRFLFSIIFSPQIPSFFWPQLIHFYSPKQYYWIVTVHDKFRKTLFIGYISFTRWNRINFQIKEQVLNLMPMLHRGPLIYWPCVCWGPAWWEVTGLLSLPCPIFKNTSIQYLQAFQKLFFLILWKKKCSYLTNQLPNILAQETLSFQ